MTSQHKFSLIWRVAIVVGIASLAGCAGLDDPYQRDGTWRPEGLNDANLAAMVAHPSDLVVGVNDPVSSGQLAAASVRRLLIDRVKPLPSADIGQISISGQGAAPTAAGGEGQ